eukprot:CAMPEP_0204863746 /NCGR_PEP_ID=MMETSP1348-20121228/3543_1 /ASSEMBLY_ACC=CAM_ASM_000700 /TAXON_ID=215587 /ORGANISM="Aplanochytrium stocchinoi, Strain GSBS06" /LENGTH=446 /DNA_ID=CAMNT_0052014161 /DNA_START=117 /DNA_END=1457 /DNA_ORIENTATION=-
MSFSEREGGGTLLRKASRRAFDTLNRQRKKSHGITLKHKGLDSSFIGAPPPEYMHSATIPQKKKSLPKKIEIGPPDFNQDGLKTNTQFVGRTSRRKNGSTISSQGTIKRRHGSRKHSSLRKSGHISRAFATNLISETGIQMRSQASLLLDEVLEARESQVCPIASKQLVRSVDTPRHAVTLSGGKPAVKQGIVGLVKSYINEEGQNKFDGMNRILPSFKKHLLNLRDGNLEVYAVPKKWSNQWLDDEELAACKKITDVKLVHLEMVYYPELDSRCIVLVSMQPQLQNALENDQSKAVNVSHYVFREELIFLRLESAMEAQDWVKSILRELQNQAIMYDRYTDVMRSNPQCTPEMIDTFLRASVDMWTLAKGPNHRMVIDARDRLVEWLEHICRVHEAKFWSDISATKIMEEERHHVALDKLRTEIEEEFPELCTFRRGGTVNRVVV